MTCRLLALACSIVSMSACTGFAQSYQLQKSNSIDLTSFFFGGGTSQYGVNPLSVAFDGGNAYVGGYNNFGGNAPVGVVRIDGVLGNAPAAAGLAGAGASYVSTPFRGFNQMSARNGELYLAYDNNEGITPFIRKIDATTGAQLWQVDAPAGGARPIAMAIDPRGGATDAGVTGVPGLRFMSQDPAVSGGATFSLRLSDGAVVYGPGSIIEQGGAGVFITAGQRAFGTFSNRNIAFDEAGNFLLSTGTTHGVATRTGDNNFSNYNVAAPGAGSTGTLDKQGGQVVNGEGINSEFMPAVGGGTASDFMAVNTRVPSGLNNIFNYVAQDGTVQSSLDARNVHLRNLDGTLRAGAVNTLTGAEDFLGAAYAGQVKDLATARDANGNPVLLVLSFEDRRLDIYQIEPTWTASTGDWDTAANWNLGLIADGATQNARFTQTAAPSTVTLNSAKTSKLVKFDSTNGYTISGTGTLTLSAPAGKAANIAVLAGNHTIAVPVVAATGTDLRVPAGSTLTLSGGLTGAGATKRDLGVAEAKHVRLSALNVADGTLKILAGSDSTSRVGTLQVANSGGVYSATLDINNAGLIVDYTGADPEADIAAAIASGRAAGTWAGTGISSSFAAAAPSARAIGLAQASEYPGLTSFGGLPVDTTAVLIRGTLRGDTDLNATVNFDDLLALAQNYGGTGLRWSKGDTDGNGTVDFDDLLALAQNYGGTALASGDLAMDGELHNAFVSDWALARQLVPEPASLGLIVCGFAAARRRRV